MAKPQFEFNKEEHYYTLDGKRMYGTTTVLGVIAKPALIPWAANMAVGYIETEVAKIASDNDGLEYLKVLAQEWANILKEAKSAHRKKKESAGEKGTDVHGMIEIAIKEAIEKNKGFISELLFSDTPQVKHFYDWARNNKIKFLASEKQLYSESMWVAGTTDMVFEKEGKKFIGDIKTSSAIYPEHFYQMAAYRMMLEEMGEKDFEASAIIRLGKDGKFNEEKDVQYHYDYDTDKSAFLGALAIFKANESYKQINK